MKRFVLSTLAMGLFMAVGITACSGNSVDSAAAFSAVMDARDAPASGLPAARATP